MDSRRILVVDDQPMVRQVCEVVLSRGGFEVIITTNGAEGLAAFAQRQNDIELILADVTMPVTDGIHMVRQIHKIDPRANVLLMTGYDPEFTVPAELHLVCGLIRKPFTASRLLEAVEKCLKGKRHASLMNTGLQMRAAQV